MGIKTTVVTLAFPAGKNTGSHLFPSTAGDSSAGQYPLRECEFRVCQVMIAGPATTTFDGPTRKGLNTLVGIENLEERWDGEGDVIDRQVVEYLRNRFG